MNIIGERVIKIMEEYKKNKNKNFEIFYKEKLKSKIKIEKEETYKIFNKYTKIINELEEENKDKKIKEILDKATQELINKNLIKDITEFDIIDFFALNILYFLYLSKKEE